MIAPFKPRDPKLVVALLLGAGLLLSLLDSDLPLIKYSVVYVKAASKVIEGRISLGDLLADPNAHAYEKPLGVVLSLLPFTALLGYRVGALVHSYTTTALFALAALFALRRVGRRMGIPEERLGAMLVVTFLNPVAIYQFWAVGPDSVFAAAFLAAFVLLDRLLEMLEARQSPGRERIWPWFAAYLLALYSTVAVKFYGLAAIPLHALYAGSMLRSSRVPLRALVPFAAPLVLLIAAVVVYPGMQVVGTKDFRGYVAMTAGAFDDDPGGVLGDESRLYRIAGNAEMVVAALLLSLNALVVCLFRRYRRQEWLVVAMVILFIGGLVLHRGTYYNMRFLLPIAPFVAALVVGSPLFSSRRLVGIYAAVATVLVLLFNVPNPLAIALTPHGKKGEAFSAERGKKLLNNLRLGARMNAKAFGEGILETVPKGAPIVVVTSYFGDAYFGVDELLGSFEPPGKVSYARSCAEVSPPADVFYLIVKGKRCDLPFPARREKLLGKLERVTVIRGSPATPP